MRFFRNGRYYYHTTIILYNQYRSCRIIAYNVYIISQNEEKYIQRILESVCEFDKNAKINTTYKLELRYIIP